MVNEFLFDQTTNYQKYTFVLNEVIVFQKYFRIYLSNLLKVYEIQDCKNKKCKERINQNRSIIVFSTIVLDRTCQLNASPHKLVETLRTDQFVTVSSLIYVAPNS